MRRLSVWLKKYNLMQKSQRQYYEVKIFYGTIFIFVMQKR